MYFKMFESDIDPVLWPCCKALAIQAMFEMKKAIETHDPKEGSDISFGRIPLSMGNNVDLIEQLSRMQPWHIVCGVL